MTHRGNNEGSIYKRKDGRWAASVTLPGGKRRAFYGKTRQEAAHKLQAAQRVLNDGLPIASDRLTVKQWLEQWLDDNVARKVRVRTLHRYQEIVQYHLAPRLGAMPLARLGPADVERLMNEGLRAGKSPQSVAHHRAVLRTALNVAMRHGIVARNVASLADPPHIPKREHEAITPAKARAILDAVQGDRLEALFAVALASGLRGGEALGLRWEDVDLEGGTMAIRRTLQRHDGEWLFLEPKTRTSRRTLRLPAPVVASLRHHKDRQAGERLLLGPSWEGGRWGNMVFTDETGAPLAGDHVLRRFHKLLEKAGLPRMRYHDLRHGAASLMAAMGVPARVAMEIMGHSQISTTMNIYAHIAAEWQQDAVDKMATGLWGVTES